MSRDAVTLAQHNGSIVKMCADASIVCSLGKGAGSLSRLEAWTTALQADVYKASECAALASTGKELAL